MSISECLIRKEAAVPRASMVVYGGRSCPYRSVPCAETLPVRQICHGCGLYNRWWSQIALRRHVLGYRSTPAGLRMLRHRIVCPAGVIVDSSPRSRLLRCDVESRAHRAGRFRVGLRRCRPVVQPIRQWPRSAHRSSHQPEIVHIPFRRPDVIGADIVTSPQAKG
jgi:hypothetical protein